MSHSSEPHQPPQHPDLSRRERAGYIYAALTATIWAGFVLVSRIGGTGPLNAWDITALRFGTAALILLPAWLWWRRVPLLNARMVALALIGGIGYAAFVYAGFRYAPAAHGALLVSGLLPFTMALCVWLVLHERPHGGMRAGLVLIALGVGLLAFDTLAHPVDGAAALRGSHVWLGDAFLVAGSLCWALYSVLIKRWQIGPWETTIGVALMAGAIYLPVYVLLLPKNMAAADTGTILLQAVYQGVLVVIVAMVLYLQAMARLGPARLGAFMAMVPAVAGIGVSLALGEPLTAWLIGGLLLTSAGAWVSARK